MKLVTGTPHVLQRRGKVGVFVLEGLNGFAAAYYFNYLFFFMQEQFGFTDKGNLALSALNGLVYAISAWRGGKYAQKHGFRAALRLGFSGMALALIVGGFLPSVTGQMLALVAWTVAMCFTWPTLEAMTSEGETPRGLQRMLGIYNLVWAGTAALAYFSGGAIREALGGRSIFFLPASLHLVQLGVLWWMGRQPAREIAQSPVTAPVHDPVPPPGGLKPELFLKLAWVANPLSYIAINTLLSVIPTLAKKLELGPVMAGVFCSIWFFARLGTFLLLWLWPGWHYRQSWFWCACGLLLGGFVTILLSTSLITIVLAQCCFGIAVGLFYYSSLYYSMHVGHGTQGEHGGLHEAAIGAGICLGPAVGAGSLYLFPKADYAPTIAVGGLLVIGIGYMWCLTRRTSSLPSS